MTKNKAAPCTTKTRVLIIDSEKRTVTEGFISSLFDAQAIVGGLIERAGYLANGDEVFVNEEGLLLKLEHFFAIEGLEGVFAGNGYITGPTGEDGEETPAQTTEVRIRWATREQLAPQLANLDLSWQVVPDADEQH